MADDNIRRFYGSAAPDLEDWWGDRQPEEQRPAQKRPRYREQSLPPAHAAPLRKRAARRKEVQASRLLMYAALGVALVCLFMQVGRYAQLAAQTKQVSGLISEIRRLETERDNLALRLDVLQNIQRVQEVATTGLYMAPQQDSQIRILALAGRPIDQQTQTAAIPAQ